MSEREISTYRFRIRELLSAVERMIEGNEPDDDFFRGYPRPVLFFQPTSRVPERKSPIAFNLPIRRSHRLKTDDGRTSFHFSHRSVVRVRSGTFVDGHFLEAGSAKAHCQYIERETAVAILPEEINATIDNPVPHYMESANDLRPYRHHPLAKQRDIGTGLYRADLLAAPEKTPGNGLRPMPGVSLASLGWKAGLLLRNDQATGDLSGTHALQDGSLRGATDRTVGVEEGAGAQIRRRGRAARAVALSHLAYIERERAVARQPDGKIAIITNIDDDPEERMRFWHLVEGSETAPGPDQMSLDISRAPEFWGRVLDHEDCPPDLCAALLADSEDDRNRFTIESGIEVRKFLAKVPGWIGKSKQRNHESDESTEKLAPLATFHDGRGGRIQYRIVFELPSELSFDGRLRIMNRLGHEFEKRRLGFNAAMHAPDHASDERQWHGHLDYYDRPAWRLSHADVEGARSLGLLPVGQGVGEWSFIAQFRKLGSTKTTKPFRLSKHDDVRDRGWIDHLRSRFAFIVNDELRRGGHYPRYDPRDYDAMGIKAEPGEHLGTKLNAAEGKGIVSPKGLANEQKQWEAINRQLARMRTKTRTDIRRAAKKLRDRLAAVQIDSATSARIEREISRLEQASRAAANAWEARERAHHLTARACSRPMHIRDVNQRWLNADAAGEKILSRKQRIEREELRDVASQHLRKLKPFQEVASEIIAQCEAAHGQNLRQKVASERLVHQLLVDVESLAARAPESLVPSHNHLVTRIAATSPVAPTAQPTAENQLKDWLAQFDRQPRIIKSHAAGFQIEARKDDPIVAHPAIQAALRARHVAQERKVAFLVARVTEKRGRLTREQDGWHFRDKNPDVVNAFLSFRDHPKLRATITTITGSVSPPPPRAIAPAQTRPNLPDRPAATAGNVGAPAPGHVALPRPTPGQIPPPRSAPDTVSQAPPPPTVSQRSLSSQAQDLARLISSLPPSIARTTTPTPDTPGKKLNPARTPVPARSNIQKILESKARLAITADGGIDVEALRRQGHTVTLSERKDARLLGLAHKQSEYARTAVTNFIAKTTGFVVERNGRLVLSEKATPAMQDFVRYHDDDEMQNVLRRGLQRPAPATPVARSDVGRALPAPSPLPAAACPSAPTPAGMAVAAKPGPHLVELTRDDAMIAAAKAYHDDRRRRAQPPPAQLPSPSPQADTVAERPAPSPTISPPRRPPPGWGNDGFGR